MDFLLNHEERQLQQLARTFAGREIIPQASELDRTKTFPQAIYDQALSLGLLNLTVPEEYGGAGLGCLALTLVTEELCRGCVGVGAALSINSLAADAVIHHGSEEQKQWVLPRLVAGELASYAATEPGAGSDVAGLQTRAVRDGDDYVLSGSKTWISNANLASFFVVFARTGDGGSTGLSVFIVERSTPGLSVGEPLDKLGQRCAPTCEIFFDSCRIPASQRIGEEGQGFRIAMDAFDHSRPMVAAFGVGVHARCLEESLAYAQTRQTMGQPIIRHQLIAAKLAEMSTSLEAARLLAYRAAWLIDHGQRNTLAASQAKLFAAESVMAAATEAVQIFGGMGYSTEYPVEKLFRDAKVLQIYEGTSEIQKLVIARELQR
ncbi:acyl-CoA dehydrogenase family protein [Deinococcus humi]|uniref:Acyl-CoA dehydrogenase n=1 Tax=Deinococcus humi TaxID=662880 RepID=A0A7W8JZ17_9DEIO|nr:acyl-CoA dehydrogenase family protein [Deinococcus humi]MBB5364548.1 acyl-CoA dehydrogenase [Deinococcus humi]GGO38128.1 acyl-CoA dehydrogenase [Deinococcus humi]